MANDNEGKVCDAVLRLLEMHTGEARSNVFRPDANGDGPPVELRFMLGERDYAIEHTRIEAFEDQIRMDNEFHELVMPIIEELSGILPGPAIYTIYFPINARVGGTAKPLGELRNNLTLWVRQHARRLHEVNTENPVRFRWPRGIISQYQSVPPGFPYEVTLRREAHWARSTQHHGVLYPSRFAPNDIENLRADRLRKALATKCPKLQACKHQGAHTILIFEDGDISLSNHVLIGDQLGDVLTERTDLPDGIYLVKTCFETWDIRPLKLGDTNLPDDKGIVFNSADLNNITEAA